MQIVESCPAGGQQTLCGCGESSRDTARDVNFQYLRSLKLQKRDTAKEVKKLEHDFFTESTEYKSSLEHEYKSMFDGEEEELVVHGAPVNGFTK